jgi:inorganic triphosphatase YgiF
MGAAPEHGQRDEHLEIEVKLHVPASAFDAVEAALRDDADVAEIRLRAEYFDTDDWVLAARGLTWRMRREDDRWVQTLKGRAPVNGAGDDMARVEHDVDVTDRADGESAPPLDAALHDGHLGTRLRTVLGEQLGSGSNNGIAVAAQFATDVLRTERRSASDLGSVILALDRGVITAGGMSQPVSELEIELVDGSPDAVIAEAERWADRFGLERDPVNKARRGRALADEWRAHRAAAANDDIRDRDDVGDVGTPDTRR